MTPRDSTGRRGGRPVGAVTRGKTAANLLRRVDALLVLLEEPLLRRKDGEFSRACFVDLGFGAEPTTTLEAAARLRGVRPDLRVLGVEIDPDRVAAAKPFEDELTAFRLGGFNLPLETGESVRLIRAFNVLRQYDEQEVLEAHRLGLASLHQLRGRLARGADAGDGECWLFADPSAFERLRFLEQHADGFTVAEADLAARGPGALRGLRQHGRSDFLVFDPGRDGDLVRALRQPKVRSWLERTN